MKYFIGVLLEDESQDFYQKLTKDLSKKFKIENLAKKLKAHITLIPPFEMNEFLDKESLEEFVKRRSKHIQKMRIIGENIEVFNNPDASFIYLSFREKDTERLKTASRELEDFIFFEPSYHFQTAHLSLAKLGSQKKAKDIQEFLKRQWGHFLPLEIPVRTLVIWEKKSGISDWKISKKIKLS